MENSNENICLKKVSNNFINTLYKNGFFEVLMFLLIEQSIMYTGVFIAFCNIFISANMDYVCNISVNVTDFQATYNQCLMMNITSNKTEKCIFGYKFKADNNYIRSSVMADFELICDNEFYNGAAESSIMAGFFVGGIVGPLIGDRYGRRFVLFFGLFLAGGIGIIVAFANNIYLFIIGNFFFGTMREVTMSVGFVFGLEFIPNQKQSLYGMITQILWSMNLIILGLMAYFIRDWRYLQICGSSLIFICGFFLFLVPESPRWLIAKGKLLELQSFVDNFANRFNRIKYNSSEINLRMFCRLNERSLSKNNRTQNSPFDICRSNLLSKWMIILILGWAFIVLSYYGSTMLSVNIPGNKYVSFMSISIIEVPTILFTFKLLHFGRNIVFLTLAILCGICYISVSFVSESFPITILILSIVGKGALSAIFYIIVVTSVYIYPTTIRSFGTSFPSSLAKLIAITIPYFVKLYYIYSWLPTLIIGTFACFIGIINVMFPDWINGPLPETLEDLQAMRRSSGLHVKLFNTKVEIN